VVLLATEIYEFLILGTYQKHFERNGVGRLMSAGGSLDSVPGVCVCVCVCVWYWHTDFNFIPSDLRESVSR
jgi:hypothetical protein